ncbi:MAG: hypothetical protein ABUK01_01940 [Leptospirales bacterium]
MSFYKKRRMVLPFFLFFILIVFSGCAAGDPKYVSEAPAGFWAGLWHGAISIVTLIIGIFSDTVRVYEINNTGGWYDFGFLMGAVSIWGGASKGGQVKSRKKTREWQKFERKFSEYCHEWAEEEDDEEWREIAKKVEEKLKRKMKDWAEKE